MVHMVRGFHASISMTMLRLLVVVASISVLVAGAQQTPFIQPSMSVPKKHFAFKEAEDIFSPKDLIQLPRPGVGKANPAGDLVLVGVSKYSFEDKENKKSIWVAPLTGKLAPYEISLTRGGQAFWLDSRTVAHVVSKEDDKTHQEVYAISLKYETESELTPDSPVLIGEFPPGVEPDNFIFDEKSKTLVFSASVFSDRDLSTVKKQQEEWEERGNTAYTYDESYERHWDTWRGPKRLSLFINNLVKADDGKWEFGKTFGSPLNTTDHHAPVEPFGDTGDFDLSGDKIVYTTLDSSLPQAWHTRQDVYIVSVNGGSPKKLTSGEQGATHAPTFSSKGDKVAWLELDQDGYESDRAKIVLYDVKKDVRFTITQDWDRSGSFLAFSPDDSRLYFTAGDHAQTKVFSLPVPETPSKSTTHPDLPSEFKNPLPLTESHAVSHIQPLSNGRLVFTQSSLTSPNNVFLLSGLDESNLRLPLAAKQITHFAVPDLEKKLLDGGESVWFEGAESKQVQGWVLRPKGWKQGEKKKWPVVLLIHGGPQGAWEDSWSTRWNPNIFAQQGYFAVALNPTGSTTFGQNFTDAITEDWGGKPFVDLQKGWEYVLERYREIDANRAVAAGASWGGYAINWLQGHPEYGFNFKALVGHDGVFNTHYNGFTTDELFFFNHDFGGPAWEEKGKTISEKFNPANFVHNFSTPQLLIHGSLDYRLPETESIGMFHALLARKVPTRLVVFPDENHWVLKQGNSLKWHYEVFRWFDQFVGEDAH